MSIELERQSEKDTLFETEQLDKKILQAYKEKDASASRRHHQDKQKIKYSVVSDGNGDGADDSKREIENYDIFPVTEEQASQHISQEKKHKGAMGEFIKSIIFGGLDGIITLFAIVASISGSNLNVETVLVLGFAKLIGDGISMGIGDFLSEKAEIDFVRSELKREKWEMENYETGEMMEMIDIYKSQGVSETDAKYILQIMIKYPDFFLNHMMMAELDLNANVIDDNPMKNGAVTFISFLIFGIIPLLVYLIFYGIDMSAYGIDWKLIIAILVTLVTLFGMGAVKGHYCHINICKSGVFVMLNGVLAAGSAYLIGWGLSEALGVQH